MVKYVIRPVVKFRRKHIEVFQKKMKNNEKLLSIKCLVFSNYVRDSIQGCGFKIPRYKIVST